MPRASSSRLVSRTCTSAPHDQWRRNRNRQMLFSLRPPVPGIEKEKEKHDGDPLCARAEYQAEWDVESGAPALATVRNRSLYECGTIAVEPLGRTIRHEILGEADAVRRIMPFSL